MLLGTIKYGSAKHVVTLKDPVAIAKVSPDLYYSPVISINIGTGYSCCPGALYRWYILHQDLDAHPLPPHLSRPTLPRRTLGRW